MTVLGVAYHLDSSLAGFDFPLAPDHLVTADLPAGGPPWQRMAELYDTVATEVAAAARAGEAPMIQSGDCTTSLGVVAGLQRAGLAPGVVWFDAHGDIHTPESTASGYLGGMPLRMLAGEGDPTVARRTGLRPVPESDIVLVDARDLDPPERAYLAGAAVRQCAVSDVEAALPPSGPLYLHIDVDIVDPDELPDLLYPVPGGPALSDVADAARAVLSTGRVAALGLACTWRRGSVAVNAVRPCAERLAAAL